MPILGLHHQRGRLPIRQKFARLLSLRVREPIEWHTENCISALTYNSTVSRTSDSKHTLPRSSLSESAVIDPSNEISDEVETRKLQRPNPKCLRFSDGDVYIELQPRSSVYQYQLHSSVLVRVSEKFKEIASQPPPEEPDEKLAAKFRKERCIAAWFKLYYDTEWKEQLLKRTVSQSI